MDIEITRKQKAFMDSGADEVLFGGAAGGGKSWAQLIDAFLYALRCPGSKQLVLRRTFPELEKSLIRVALGMYPREVWRYNDAKHVGRFANGSLIDFGYCDAEKDVYNYQSAEYDVIRFDELTHFAEWMYVYLISRLRGANDFPKQVKSSTNPGGVGHVWVKKRFIDPAPAGTLFDTPAGSRVFIPSRVEENRFLMDADPEYVRRLRNLPEREQKALLHGEWDLFDGQAFGEFSHGEHVVRPFEIPAHWRVYRVMDYGLDMLCCLWVAVDETGRGVVYREVYEPGLIISAAARRILEAGSGERIQATLAPPDLWSRRQETGKSVADIFGENGIALERVSNDRVAGWMAVHEWLRMEDDEAGGQAPRLRIFEGCRNLIRTLPAVQVDAKNPSDVAREPHELTHAPDALRYFCVYWTSPAAQAPGQKKKWTDDMLEDWRNASPRMRRQLTKKWGDPA